MAERQGRGTNWVGLTLGLGVILCAGAARADEAIDQAAARLDKVEAGYPALGPGDIPAGNVLLEQINAAVADLKRSTESGSEAWRAQYERGRALDQKVRARMKEEAPPDEHLLAAAAKLDEVESGLAALAPGDVPGGNAMTALLNAAVADLKASARRGSPAWRAQAQRANDLNERIQARMREPAAADARVAAAKAKLDAVEAKLAGLESGDIPAANALIAEINVAIEDLRASEAKSSAAWRAQAERADAISAKVQAVAKQPRKPGPTPSGEPAKPLEFVDKRALGFFDKDYARSFAYLEAGDPTELQDPANVAAYQRTAASLEERLEGIQNQAHPDVQQRWEQLRRYKQVLQDKLSKAQAGLTAEDERILGLFAKRYGPDLAALESEQGTVLVLGGGTAFDDAVKAQKGFLDRIQNKEHDKAREATAKHDAFVKLLAAKAAASRQAAEGLGDVRARFQEIAALFTAKAGYPPHLAQGATPEEMQAFARAVAGWRKQLDEAVGYLRDVQRFSPEYQGDVDFGNAVRRFLGEVPPPLDRVVETAAASFESPLRRGLEVDPAALDTSTLRQAAYRPGDDPRIRYIREAIAAARAYKSYQTAMAGKADPALDRHLADLEGRIADFERRVQAQLASERMPAPETEDAELLAIARGAIQGSYDRLELYRGKRSAKKVEIEDDVLIPWDYDFFSCHVAKQAEDGNHYVYMYVIKYYRKGVRRELEKWIVDETHTLHRILPENIAK